MPENHVAKDAWDKLSKVGNFLAIVAIPVVLGVYGNVVSTSISEQETSLAYVELAVSILGEAPEEQSAADKALRDWAVRILQRYSDEPMNQAREALINRRLPTPMTLNADAVRDLMSWRGLTATMTPGASSTSPDDESILVPRSKLRTLDPRLLRQLDIDPATLRDQSNQ